MKGKKKAPDAAAASGGGGGSSAAPAAGHGGGSGTRRNDPVEKHYTIGKEIGRGGMSVVKEGTQLTPAFDGDKGVNEKWALKFIQKDIVDDLDVLLREMKIMTELKHRNVLYLKEVFESDKEFVLVTELVSGGELFEKIVAVGNYSEHDAAKIIKQVLEGVEYLHQNNVAHRDLKPENLLVGGKDEDEIKIADFGLSKSFGAEAQKLETSCGTPDYVAPEVLRAEAYKESVDMWSVGVITYILLCGFPPFWGESQGELFDKILSVKFDFPSPEWDQVSEEAKQFIRELLLLDADKRLTATKALKHPWVETNAGEKAPEKAMRRLDSQASNLSKYMDQRAAGLPETK